MVSGNYKGVKAGAIASGFFVAATSFLMFYFIAVFLVVAPEGRPDDANRAGLAFDLCLVASASVALWLGWRTKRYFDRRAGRR
ncbi:MAG: hypothetical protein DI605_19695 [Sphingomonas sp.]|nr:MAG: hypothetical protein DI605_19695 [Sphingomonas sp.]